MEDEHVKKLMQVLELSEGLSYRFCRTLDSDALEKAQSVSSGEKCVVQVIPERIVLGWRQLALPLLLTRESYLKGYSVSSKPSIQYILFLAATRQISKAVEMLKEFSSPPYIIVTDCSKEVYEGIKEVINCEEIPPTSLGGGVDVEAVKSFYGLERSDADRESLEMTVLTKISSSKLLMRK